MKENMALSDYLLSEIRFGYFFKYLSEMRLLMKRWYGVVPLLFNMRPVTIEFRNGRKIRVETTADFRKYWDGVENMRELIRLKYGSEILVSSDEVTFGYRKRKVHFYNPPAQDELLFFVKEQFFEDQYRQLRCAEETVIDIGAGIGDSAIYFSLNGARSIYAFELYPYSYRLAKRNIALNHLSRKIKLFNIGCSWKEGFAKIDPAFISKRNSSMRRFRSGKLVRVLTLKEIADRYASGGAVLKLDCEGCEYGVILGADTDTLRKFKRIIIEYHRGYGDLSRRLADAGFMVKHTVPKKLEGKNRSVVYLGLIYAERNQNWRRKPSII